VNRNYNNVQFTLLKLWVYLSTEFMQNETKMQMPKKGVTDSSTRNPGQNKTKTKMHHNFNIVRH